MKADDKSHYLIYKVLKVTLEEGELIDIYQNKGRFLLQICWILFGRSSNTMF